MSFYFFPEPIKFSYQFSRERMKLKGDSGLIEKFDMLLRSGTQQLLDKILEGISQVCFPELKAKDFLEAVK